MAGDGGPPARLPREAINGGEPKPGAFAYRFGGKKRIEHFGQRIRRDAGPVVDDFDLQIVARHHIRLTQQFFGADMPVLDRDFQLAAPLHRVARVDDEV